MAIAANPGRVYNPFFVHAGVGLGKTHLLQAICLQIAEATPEARMYYTSCEGFVTQFFESVQHGEMADFQQYVTVWCYAFVQLRIAYGFACWNPELA
jgi:chromosomal replication initiator protein